MIKVLLLLGLLFAFSANAQTKEELIGQILKTNRLEGEMSGLSYPFDSSGNIIPTSENYLERSSYDNFQVLKTIISKQNLIDLTSHNNGVLRLFAVRELIKQRELNFDYTKFFQKEFDSIDTIEMQYGCIISMQPTYSILLQDWSGDWNYARTTDSADDLRFLNKILKPIDNWILYKRYPFSDNVYEDIFDRQIFPDSATERIIEIATTSPNYWAFTYLQHNNKKVFEKLKPSIIKQVLQDSKKENSKENGSFFWFFRYFVTIGETKNAVLLLNNVARTRLTTEELNFQLGGINKKAIRKFKQDYR